MFNHGHAEPAQLPGETDVHYFHVQHQLLKVLVWKWMHGNEGPDKAHGPPTLFWGVKDLVDPGSG